MGELLALSALAMFAANALVVQSASGRVNYEWGFFIGLVANVAFALVVLAVQLLFVTEGFAWDWAAVGFFVLAGLFATYLGRLLFFGTVVGMGPSRASSFQISQPAFAAVLAWLFLGQRLRLVEIGLIGVIIGGLLLVNRSRRHVPAPTAGDRAPEAPPAAGGSSYAARLQHIAGRRHLLIALGSAVSYGVANVFRGAAILRWNEPVAGALLGAAVGVLIYLLLHIRLAELLGRFRRSDPTGLVLFCVSGVLTIGAQIAMIGSMRFLPVAITNVIALALPIIVIPVSVFFLGNREGVTRLTSVGAVVTWLGVGGLLLS